MSPYKPMKLKQYQQWIHQYGWSIEKGSIDYILFNEQGGFQCQIKINHPGPKEVDARSVKKTEAKLKEAGL